MISELHSFFFTPISLSLPCYSDLYNWLCLAFILKLHCYVVQCQIAFDLNLNFYAYDHVLTLARHKKSPIFINYTAMNVILKERNLLSKFIQFILFTCRSRLVVWSTLFTKSVYVREPVKSTQRLSWKKWIESVTPTSHSRPLKRNAVLLYVINDKVPWSIRHWSIEKSIRASGFKEYK